MEQKVGKYTVKTEQDPDPFSPREDDNLGIMVCFSNSHNLGDKHDVDFNDYSSWDEMEQDMFKSKKACAVLPIYVYEHGGLTINTTGFSCRWDSRRLGLIYMTKETYLSNFGGKIMTKKRKEHAEKILLGEVETYDQFLTGDVYGFVISDENGNEVDSCWGYYGEEYCLQEGVSCVPEEVEV